MIVPLEWDSAHFGFPVARVEPGDAPLPDLEADLRAAREAGVRLACCSRPAEAPLAEAVLARHGGRALTASLLFAKRLDEGRRPVPAGITVERVTAGSEALRQLAPECGRYSRFRLDPEFPREAFVSLYEIWLQRSVAGEIADQVLSVGSGGHRDLGLVTIVRPDRATGRIGLIGVRDGARGKGLGRALVAAAEVAMEAAGAERTEVSTHLENHAARRLFASFGYEPGVPQRQYHFWLEPAS